MRRARSRPSTTLLSLLAVVGLTLSSCAKHHKVVADTGEPRRPPSPANMLDVLRVDSSERYSMLLTCIDQAGLTDALKVPGPLTLFAPNNAQLASAGVACSKDVKLDPGPKRALVRLLQQHVVEADVAFKAPEGFDPAKPPRGFVLVSPTGTQTVDTLLTDALSARLEISGKDRTVRRLAPTSDTVKLVGDEVRAPNGYIHFLDKVITPPPPDATPPPTTLPRPFE